MVRLRYLLLCLLWLPPGNLCGQDAAGRDNVHLEPTDSSRGKALVQPARMVQFHLSNDVSQQTDRYYTGGFRLTYIAPSLARVPFARLLFSLKGEVVQTYGLQMVLDVFTPADITAGQVVDGDRPYAGTLLAGMLLESESRARRLRLTAAFNVGVIGPASAAGRLQWQLHRVIQAAVPEGWQHQVRSDLVLDYVLTGEKALFRLARVLEGTARAGVRAGTLQNSVTAGAGLRVGKLPAYPPAALSLYHPRLGGFAFWRTEATGVGYNATLQGGVFNRSSPYTLPGAQLNRLVMSHAAGLSLQMGRAGMELGQTWLGREFKTGKPHAWNYVNFSLFF